MNIPQSIRDRNEARLSPLHPELAAKIRLILEAMELLGFPMLVTAGLRTAEEQRALFDQGRSAPGAIVTNADGFAKKSNHQAAADGFGHAVDCAFLVDGADHDGEYETATWDMNPLRWDLYGAMVENSALKWGARFTGLVDRPHAELKG